MSFGDSLLDNSFENPPASTKDLSPEKKLQDDEIDNLLGLGKKFIKFYRKNFAEFENFFGSKSVFFVCR